jgi:hypothetical protein
VDPEIRFDFGESSPEPEKLDANGFSIRWEGSVLAPETGDYEFLVRTDHAARLWVNDADRPLIDAWVKSGSDTEHRATIFLLGGRAYPLRLEFSKAKQGVDDSKKNKDKPPAVKASIALEWTLPHRTAEVVPRRNLTPNRFPRRSSWRRPSRRTTAASGMNGARRSPRPGTRPRRMRRSRSPTTSPPTSGSWAGPGRRARAHAAAPRVLPEVRRAGVPASAHR